MINQSDEQLLKTRLILPCEKNILHVFPTRSKVNCHNTMKLNELGNNVITRIDAFHFFSQEDKNAFGEVEQHLIPVNNRSAGGLQNVLKICKGARVMLIRNIQTDRGLVNGAIGTVSEIGTISQELSNPSIIYVRFDDPKVGRIQINNQHIEQSDIAINPVEHHFVYQGRHIIRRQFPLILAWASTIHKVMGISIDSAVIDIG